MTTLSFDLVSHAELTRLSAAFGAGMHVVLGAESDGTGALVELAAGIAPPRVGRVTLDGKEPFAHAAVRRRVAAVCAEEQLPPGRTVASALSTALRARSDARSVASLLEAATLSHFAPRAVADLSTRERRALALALALTLPEPTLLALFEPLALLGVLSEDFIVSALRRMADAGAIVLCTAERVEDAARLGGARSTLARGTWLDPHASQIAQSSVTLRVRSPEPERLAARLSNAPEVLAVEWAGGRELLVRGADLERVAARVVASARSESIRVEALRCDAPSLDALSRARAAVAQGRSDRVEPERPTQAAPAEPVSVEPRELQ